MKTAYLSNKGRYTIFSCGDDTIRFIAPYSLEKYEKILEWDNGYIVVLAKYRHNIELEEEYIDLIPILQHLYIDEKEFLAEIDKVEVKYA